MRLRLTEHAPMLPVTAALIAGIMIAAWRMPPVWLSAAGVVAGCGGGVAMLRRGIRTAAAVPILAAAMFLGLSLAGMQRRTAPLPEGTAMCEIELADDARPRADAATQHADARMVSIRTGEGKWQRTHARLRIYADTSLMLRAGDRIVCRGRIRGFDTSTGFSRMMRGKGYSGSLYIHGGSILRHSPGGTRVLFRTLHRRAVRRIAELPLSSGNMAVAQAVGTGETSMLGRDLRSGYSRAGTAHLLALSGLHVGIVFLFVNLLLGWLPLVRRGNIIRHAAAILLLWLYVLTTGMPAGAIRAAIMFTMLQTALAASAEYSSLNALAGAAFICLCFDTGLLFDAGFRLSYIAVAAIILCGVPLCRRLHITAGRRSSAIARCGAAAVNFITDTIVTGVVATAATAPLVSHMFGIIPLAGIIIAPAAIAAAAVTILLTAVWIALPSGFAAPLFGGAVELAAGAMNGMSSWLASHDWAAADIRLSAWQTVTAYAVAAIAAFGVARICTKNRKSENTLMK